MKERLTKKLHLSGKTTTFCQELHKAKQIAFPNLGAQLKIDCHIGECHLILSCYTFSSRDVIFPMYTISLTIVRAISGLQHNQNTRLRTEWFPDSLTLCILVR